MNEDPIVTEIRRLAAERPDHRDTHPLNNVSCKYFVDGQPSCIVGHVIHKLYRNALVAEGENADFALAEIDSSIPADVLSWAALVQVEQDKGYTWSEAVKRADVKATML